MLGLAVALDLLFGEPSNRFHPVAWMGRAIEGLLDEEPAGWQRPATRLRRAHSDCAAGALLAPAWAALEWLQSYSAAG